MKCLLFFIIHIKPEYLHTIVWNNGKAERSFKYSHFDLMRSNFLCFTGVYRGEQKVRGI